MREITYMPRCCFANISNEEKEREKKGGERSQSIPSLELALQGRDIILYPWFRAGIGDIFPVPRQKPRDEEKVRYSNKNNIKEVTGKCKRR